MEEVSSTARRWARRSLVAVALAAGLITGSGAVVADEAGPPQRVIVKYKQSGLLSAQALSAVTDSLSVVSSRLGVPLTRLRTMGTDAEVVRVDRRLDALGLQSLLAELKADPRVEYAEEDKLMHPLLTPNDSQYSSQWDLFETSAGINAPTAWDTTSGSGVVVASIDTGYRPHADLVGNILQGYDFISDTTVSNDGDGRDSDAKDPGDWSTAGQCGSGSAAENSSWHGTHVAGTVAAVTNNSTGVAAIAYSAKIVPLRVLGRCGGYTSDIADAIIWGSGGSVSGVPANANPAKVESLSLGGSGACDSTTQTAVNSARSRGTTVVVAAGNSNANAANFSPASCTGVIAVASVGRTGGRAYYSNYGTVVAIAAPGGDQSSGTANGILSTFNSGTTTPGADSYGYYQGTSQATPHVAGVAALLYAVKPSITPDEVKTALTSTARAFPATCSQCGAGIVNAAAAVSYVKNGGSTGSSCPAGYTAYTGTISSTGSSLYAPSTTGFVPTANGTLAGQLTGPASGADFDLYLQRKSGSSWTQVAASEGSTASESISYTSGSTSYTYRWRIYSYSGTGSFTFCGKPQ